MKTGIEVFIVTVEEPQLDACLQSVKEQFFDKVTVIKNVVPVSAATNQAYEKATYSRVLMLAGDMILYPHARYLVKRITVPMAPCPLDFQWEFGLFDTFLKESICCAKVINPTIAKKFLRNDVLGDDLEAAMRIEKNGYRRYKLWRKSILLGTHFDKPDTFQIFRNFYVKGAKAKGRDRPELFEKYNNKLHKLLTKAKYPQTNEYSLAIDALELGYQDSNYPGSNNIDYDREVYEKWANG